MKLPVSLPPAHPPVHPTLQIRHPNCQTPSSTSTSSRLRRIKTTITSRTPPRSAPPRARLHPPNKSAAMAVPNGRHLYYPARPPTFHLLEITLVSAQGLHKAPRAISTYASAWVDPAHKLYTRVDRVGLTDPTWNEKFVFRVDDTFLRSDTSGVDVHLHANHGRLFPLRDHLLGTVRVVLSTLRPVPGARRFVALQVRRPVSLRPQGILNIGVALLDPFARSMPLCCGIRSTSAYKDLIGVGEGDHRRSASEGCEGGRLERKRSVEVEGVEEEKEREELETKLEIWKADMSPDKYEGRNRIKKRSSIRRLSFFSCTTEIECSEEEKPTKVTIP